MDKQTKIIFILLVIIAILAIIFGLKVAGVIKPAEKEATNVIEENNTMQIEKEKNKSTINSLRKNQINLLRFFKVYGTIISIIMFVLNMVLAVGAARLYRKINMPEFAVMFQYFFPIINLILGFGRGFISNLIGLIVAIIYLDCVCCFFGALGMSKWWPLAGVLGIILVAIGLFYMFWLIIGIILLLMYLYAHIISSIRLAKKFDKGILFTVLLILLPAIFQPVLGFEK